MRIAPRLIVVSAVILAGCGGGGGGGGDPFGANGPTFSGTVAVGEPLAGVTVQITGGLGQAHAVTDAAGRYSVTLPGTALGARSYSISTVPPSIGASNLPPAYSNLYAVTNRMGGTLNVTPLTTLLVAQLTGRPKAQGVFELTQGTLTDTQISTARQQVAAYLLQRPDRNDGTLTDPVNVSAVTDFIHTPFTAAPGNPYDDAIERLAQTFINGETIQGVEQHMLTRDDPAADLLSVLSFDINANCTVTPGASPGLPSGPVRITAGPGGAIAIGNYMRTLGPGDGLQISTNQPGDDTWAFVHTGSGDRFEVSLHQTSKLSHVTLRRAFTAGGGSTQCFASPLFPDLGSQVPTVLPQIRLLDQAITNPFFSCTGMSFPGIVNAGNTLSIDNNGALRVAAGGHVLHLPSLPMSINADIVSNAGMLGTLITSAAFSRTFTGGFDEFSINLLPSGAIQQVRFGQQRNSGASSSAICP